MTRLYVADPPPAKMVCGRSCANIDTCGVKPILEVFGRKARISGCSMYEKKRRKRSCGK